MGFMMLTQEDLEEIRKVFREELVRASKEKQAHAEDYHEHNEEARAWREYLEASQEGVRLVEGGSPRIKVIFDPASKSFQPFNETLGGEIGMNKCVGIFGWLFGHNFRARFDIRQPSIHATGGVAFMKALQIRIYRGDVCKRCGNLVNEKEVTG